ncbi:hypothetical protein HGP14_07475 [Rhizobium sp. P32RR-XVIII]|uniref:hypothetical protein n=1 Tax=Rhizobium sp. P32RR-XVIII TaxID=2726738 RepID=UPI0014574A1B|nr:hypothetical protein [Rhizobium sp. P32RR-XVIII]NLS03211.1 hypothetical protein [Rhizobium sp. P32RR-XVIII]
MEAETLDITHVRLGDRPLIVCDVDDVVLQFIDPFQRFLLSEGHELLPRSFRLHGNIVSRDGVALEDIHVSRLIDTFFERQEKWQLPLSLAVETLGRLAADADIVFLTAMPPVYADRRRRLLDRFGLAYPLLATRQPKGPVVKTLHGTRALPVVFIDDMAMNLHSVREHVESCLLLHMMPVSEIHRFAPAAMDGIPRIATWDEAASLIGRHFDDANAARSLTAANPAA